MSVINCCTQRAWFFTDGQQEKETSKQEVRTTLKSAIILGVYNYNVDVFDSQIGLLFYNQVQSTALC